MGENGGVKVHVFLKKLNYSTIINLKKKYFK